MRFKLFNYIFLLISFLTGLLVACGSDNDDNVIQPPDQGTAVYAKGADVSWLTEMESAGRKFYSSLGEEMECMALLKELGFNSIRLRVWVNPSDGWCNKQDLLLKAIRAKELGMRIMVDFHYSDVWADPAHQTKPEAWSSISFSELKTAVAAHTKEVLTLLKDNNVFPEWVQVGNETGDGMLWEDGRASVNMEQYAALNNAGYDAVKAVFSDAKVIVHLQEGNNRNLYRWLFDGLKQYGGKWDVIGMSLYPTVDNWQSMITDCVNNMKEMITRYGSEVMICEVGMSWDEAETAKNFLSTLRTQSEKIKQCLGLFYWEPESYGNWKGYTLGAFDNDGKPTMALDAFK